MPSKKVVIVGAGIAGLSLAVYLKKLSNPHKFSVQIVESTSRAGGWVRTHHDSGDLMEEGPDAFLTEKKSAIDYANILGIESDLISTQARYRRSFVMQGGALRAIPEGFYLAAPTHWRALIQLPGISWRGKIRLLAEFLIPPRQLDDDETVGSFLRRRLGKEVTEKLAQPMMGGIYGASIDEVSLKATFGKWRQWEQQYGGILKYLWAKRAESSQSAAGPRYNLFQSFKGGMETFINASLQYLEPHVIKKHCEINSAIKKDGRWLLKSKDGSNIEADILCLAVPAFHASKILSGYGELSEKLGQIAYRDMMVLYLRYQQYELQNDLRGFGFVVGAGEALPIVGCSFTSYKLEGRTQPGNFLLRAFIGHDQFDEYASMPEGEAGMRVHEALKKMIPLPQNPDKIWVARLKRSMPLYRLNHDKLVQDIENDADNQGDLFLVGNAYHGVGIPDTIEHSKCVAQRIVKNYD